MSKSRPNSEILFWRIVAPDGVRHDLPAGICATVNPNLPADLPPEVGLLLPGPQSSAPPPVADAVPANACAGVFLANPILNITTLTAELGARGIGWVANLPSLALHEPGFRGSLADVGLGFEREIEAMRLLRSAGLCVVAVVATPGDAEMSMDLGAGALLAVPPASAFKSGFPSARARAGQVAELRGGVPNIPIPVLGLLTDAEVSLRAAWPEGLDGGLCRPLPLQ